MSRTKFASLIGLLVIETAAASCASSEATLARSDDGTDAATIPPVAEASTDASFESDGDAVEAGPGDCASSEGGCTTTDWYSVKTNHPAGLGLAAVWGSGPNDVWAVGAAGSVIHWNGSEWQSSPIETAMSLQAIYGTGPNDVWTVATANTIYHSTGFTNGGAGWSSVTPIWDPPYGASAGTLLTIWGTGPSDIWMIGKNRIVEYWPVASTQAGWRTVDVDGTIGWTSMSSFDNHTIQSMWGSGPGDIWVVGSRGATNLSFAAHTNGVAAGTDGMPIWTEVDTQTFYPLNALWGSGSKDVWAVGNGGTLRHFDGTATVWSVVESPTTENLHGVWGSGSNDVWAVGDNGTFLHYDGTTWRASSGSFPSGKKKSLYGIWGSGSSDVWAVGDGVVMHYAGPNKSPQGGTP